MSDFLKQEVAPLSSGLRVNEFVIFSELPLEIRLSIWNLAIPQGRILLFRLLHSRSGENEGKFSFFHRLPAPNILHVCREAREEISKSFRREPYRAGTGGGIYDGDWWNPSRDTIYVPSSLPPKGKNAAWFSPRRRSFSIVADTDAQELEHLKNVHHLAWEFDSMWLTWASTKINSEQLIWNEMARWLRRFSRLKTFTWVVGSHANLGNSHPNWLEYPDAPVYGMKRLDKPETESDMTPSKININLQKASKVIGSEIPGWNCPEVRFVIDASIF